MEILFSLLPSLAWPALAPGKAWVWGTWSKNLSQAEASNLRDWQVWLSTSAALTMKTQRQDRHPDKCLLFRAESLHCSSKEDMHVHPYRGSQSYCVRTNEAKAAGFRVYTSDMYLLKHVSFSFFFFFLVALTSFFFFYLWWILSYIEMKQPWVYTCSPSRSPLPPPSPPNPSRSSQCTRSERLSHASNLGWWSVSP